MKEQLAKLQAEQEAANRRLRDLRDQMAALNGQAHDLTVEVIERQGRIKQLMELLATGEKENN